MDRLQFPTNGQELNRSHPLLHALVTHTVLYIILTSNEWGQPHTKSNLYHFSTCCKQSSACASSNVSDQNNQILHCLQSTVQIIGVPHTTDQLPRHRYTMHHILWGYSTHKHMTQSVHCKTRPQTVFGLHNSNHVSVPTLYFTHTTKHIHTHVPTYVLYIHIPAYELRRAQSPTQDKALYSILTPGMLSWTDHQAHRASPLGQCLGFLLPMESILPLPPSPALQILSFSSS